MLLAMQDKLTDPATLMQCYQFLLSKSMLMKKPESTSIAVRRATENAHGELEGYEKDQMLLFNITAESINTIKEEAKNLINTRNSSRKTPEKVSKYNTKYAERIF